MNYIKHKDNISSTALNKENFILIDGEEEVIRLTPSKPIIRGHSPILIEEETSITFHGCKSTSKGQRLEKSSFLCEPKLKSLKLSPASFKSANDTGSC